MKTAKATERPNKRGTKMITDEIYAGTNPEFFKGKGGLFCISLLNSYES